MYKINHKAVMFAFLCQLVVGGIWYVSTPLSVLGHIAQEGVTKQPTVGVALLFVLASFVYLYFVAWLLVRIKGLSGVGRFFLVIGIWLFIVVPNHALVFMNLHLSGDEVFYLLSYGAISSAIAAIILPLWRTSRSIFKD